MTDPKDEKENESYADDERYLPVEARTQPDEPNDTTSWETVLAKAARHEEEIGHTGVPSVPRSRSKAAQWTRAALPLLILLFYGGYKLYTAQAGQSRADKVEDNRSLTGVKKDKPAVKLDEQSEAVAAQVESLIETERFEAARGEIARAPQSVRDNPVLRALDTIAAVELLTSRSASPLAAQRGQFNRDLKELQATFAEDSKRRPLYEYLLLAEAKLHADLVDDPRDAHLRANEIRRLLRRIERNTERVVEFRIELARDYLLYGNQLSEEAENLVGVDTETMRSARQLYQDGLRAATAVDGWQNLTPISDDARFVQRQLLERLQRANRALEGRAGTWTGREGDPVHDAPGGAW